MPPKIPPAWREKIFTRDHLAQFAGCPTETVYTWIRFSGAMGNQIGQHHGRKLMFDRFDLYKVGILGAMASLGIGISPEIIALVNDFADDGYPETPFTRVNHCRHAAAMVEAAAIWECADASTSSTLVSPNA